jgi:hypothetical protein
VLRAHSRVGCVGGGVLRRWGLGFGYWGLVGVWGFGFGGCSKCGAPACALAVQQAQQTRLPLPSKGSREGELEPAALRGERAASLGGVSVWAEVEEICRWRRMSVL